MHSKPGRASFNNRQNMTQITNTKPPVKMLIKSHKALGVLYVLCVIGQLLCPISTSAQYCMWPTITVVWSGIGPENYTEGGAGFSYGINRECPTDCCRDVTFLDLKIVVDGNEVDVDGYQQALAEGPHTAIAKFTANGGEESKPYNFSTSFYVDKTPPAISLTKPENNISIPITDVSVAGSISDAAAKLRIAEVILGVSSGPCWFHKDFSNATVNWGTINGKYCDTDYYTAAPTLCSADMGDARASFNFNYNLRDYVDFPEGQDCGFSFTVGAVDRVGNGSFGSDSTLFNSKSISFWVDQAPPVVTINEPVVAGSDMNWGNSGAPVISGTAKDLSEITKVWLTIRDEGAKRWWDGAAWVASNKWYNGSAWQEADITVSATKSGTTNVAWEYTGLTSEIIRSGIFTITAYARDKFGHVGHTVVSGKNRGKYHLGEEEFTSVSMVVKEVSNWNTAYADTIYSFTSEPNENKIFVSAEISPPRLASTLNNYVLWNVSGANAYSGKPDAPHGGNPSNFLVEIPPVIAVPLGRPIPMGYTVFPRIEYDYEDVHREYYSSNHGNITQDNLDKLRQEYIDLKAPMQARLDFDQITTPNYPRLLDFANGDIDAVHVWWIVEDLYANAAVLDSDYTGNLNVTAGYRCPIGNKASGGVYNSRHMRGTALDYNQNFDSQENCKVWNAAKNLGVTENLLYDAFNAGKSTSSPVCPSTELQNYTHGHVAW